MTRLGAEPSGLASPGGAVRIGVFMDFHCPYSYRVSTWLDDLEPGLVEVEHRLFALEQVNHDPDAAEWRLWDQPLDYRHYRDRQDRRALAAFLATGILDASGIEADGRRRFRQAVYAARFEERLDISDPGVLDRAAASAGLPAGWLRDALEDDVRTGPARARIAADWAAARSPYRVFGVPTLTFEGAAPVYVRLAGAVPREHGPALLASFRAFRAAAPLVLEMKEPERAPEA